MNKMFTMVSIYIITIFSAVNFAQVPVITKEPVNKGVIAGQTATFFIQALGDSLKYQWFKNDTLVVGATDSAYTTPVTVLSDNKSKFNCVVTNSFGSDTSSKATLYVTAIGSRVTEGVQLLYNFNEASGTIVNDNSGIGSPYNLEFDNPSAVTWTPKGMGVNDIAYINGNSPLTKVIDACKLTDELTVEVWINPAFAAQEDGARILTLSDENNSFNFEVLHFTNGSLSFRHRSTDAINPDFISTSAGTATEGLAHFVFTRNSNGERKIYKNGVEIASNVAGGNFSNWNSSRRFQIANSLHDLRPWLGTYYLVSVYDRALNQPEVVGNYNIGVNTDNIPVIIIEPNDQGLIVGQTAIIAVKAVGDSLSFKWRKNGSDILGANNSTYTIPSVTPINDKDEYSCIVSNSFGSDTSRNAVVRVTAVNDRVDGGQTALYTFREGTGDFVYDVLGYLPADFRISTFQSVEWKPYGLLVDSAAQIFNTGPAPKFANEAIGSGEFTFEAWVKPANVTQSSATILSLGNSGDPSRINFRIDQNGGLLQSWLRTTSTPDDGAVLASPINSLGDSLVHIVFTYNRKELAKLFINGNQVSSTYLVGNLSNWNPVYYLKLANAWQANQPWLGFFNYISFFRRTLNSNEISHNYSIGPLGISLKAPGNLTALAEPGKIALAWQDSSNNEDGFIIERKHGVLNFSIIDSVTANVTSYNDSSVAENTIYTYRVKAYNLFVQTAYSNTASDTSFPSPITAPSNLTGTLSSTIVNRAQLIWQDNSSNELGFIVERKTGDSASAAPYTVLDSLNANTTAFVDSTLADTTTYTFRVKAFNSFVQSGYSNLASVTTVLSTLAAPTNLFAVKNPADTHYVKLTWNDNSTNELGFALERKTGDSASVAPFSVIDSAAANVVSYVDTSVVEFTTYTYRMRAFNQFITSAYSNVSAVTTALFSVPAPTNLLAILSPADSHNVKLTWVDNSPNEVGFAVERKTGDSLSLAPFTSIALLLANTTSYEDTSVADTTKYTYRIYAFKIGVVSNYSNLAQVITPVPVELTAFTANVVNGLVQLDWETATEINNAGFTVQRSKDNNKFIDLAFIKGKGTITTQSAYSYSDKSALSGKYSYRLKQVDFDGSVTLTKSVSVDLGLPKDYALEQNYPNPFNPSTTIRFALPINADVTINLYNTLGQEVATIFNADLEAGIHETVFNASNLSSGVYFYMLKVQGANGSNFTSTKRMILMK